MIYNDLRHFADSYGLSAMVVLYFGLCAWAFRPGSRRSNQDAAHLIFAEDGEAAAHDRKNNHG
ncbi:MULTISPECIES: cbb3-type cytochrome oxidase subunit 3 [unclassified Sphingobium]|uniref:cbb3-type cytochrome oxidase subunit 3 n=1 Tax=unclassified Sphingobium TaxID=2611147 RepID=UPI002225682A|nr:MULTISPECIES: cbb3-type cytochrome c oxidase subunit 3 [unclassified Sphingobium]MCW2381462.1 cytochrome c oxidase cbb3-type subunit 4 [Sphingobium sp. B2D3B]MCW2398431.1 cytochrome c oxidase cbb3-type subunit 4 [Sphingobium sp. B2D3C]